ncbi:MAG: alginate O-acetyltransferase AlgF [Rickettsiales bacterium]|nr:alginate O-acetyltransferase AlgF [Rickettsiales bacterium]
MKTLFSWMIAALVPFTMAQANDDELYDPAPPADSAFVRVIHAASAMDKVSATVGGITYGELSYPALSNYRIVKGGQHKATVGTVSQELTIDAGGYFTIALNDAGEVKLIKDELLSNPAKARVYFYNFSDAAQGSLFAAEHGAAILDKVNANEGGSREVNALKLALQAKAGEAVVQEFKGVQLKRRVGTSFLVTGKAGAYKALMLENEVER